MSFTLQGVENADVLIDLYDLSGRRVTRLVDENRRQGRYTDNWDATVDGTTVPPGTYLLRVAVDTDGGTLEQTRILAVAY
ncbi:MAG TPA: T9SS type A sorting domain-containing protein [Candidatus Handelsmanbacteria bacterium]|nr:T9SS type A sorting domain-containing protein [Candidatus Handelsmanbacteria bacterium]